MGKLRRFVLLFTLIVILGNVQIKASAEISKQIELSTEDKRLIDEYNKILQILAYGNEEKFLQELNYFLPKVEKIKNNKEKNNILMNIYIQQKQYKKAYDLNNKLLKNTPGDFNRHIFQCQLLEIMDKPLTETEKCYEILSLKIKDQIKNMPKNDSESLENIFSYYVILYKAGHTEYAK